MPIGRLAIVAIISLPLLPPPFLPPYSVFTLSSESSFAPPLVADEVDDDDDAAIGDPAAILPSDDASTYE